MLAWIVAIFKNPVVVFSMVKELIGVVRAIQEMFRKSPVEQQAEAQKKHDESAIKAEKDDQTDGLFGGNSK